MSEGKSILTERLKIMDYKDEYKRWLAEATEDQDVVTELNAMDDKKIEDAFYRDLAFGTGGLRGVIGAGTCLLYTSDAADEL